MNKDILERLQGDIEEYSKKARHAERVKNMIRDYSVTVHSEFTDGKIVRGVYTIVPRRLDTVMDMVHGHGSTRTFVRRGGKVYNVVHFYEAPSLVEVNRELAAVLVDVFERV